MPLDGKNLPAMDGLVGTAADADGAGVRGTSWGANPYVGTLGGGYGAWGTASGGSWGMLGGADPTYSHPVGAYGETVAKGIGVMGMATTDDGTGVFGAGTKTGQNSIGVCGETFNGTAIQGHAYGPTGLAGRFTGNVIVTGKFLGTNTFEGDINCTGDVLLTGADCAEDFDVPGETSPGPGTILVIEGEGHLCESRRPYDTRVAGVVSGAGTLKPGLILDHQPSSQRQRAPVALIGKVFCKVDATYGSIEVGDLLTTCATPGHAMKATDAVRTLGAVVGKALRPLEKGRGLIPILVSLQ